MNSQNHFILRLNDMDEFKRLNRYFSYNRDLIKYPNHVKLAKDHAIFEFDVVDGAQWLAEYFDEQFESVEIG